MQRKTDLRKKKKTEKRGNKKTAHVRKKKGGKEIKSNEGENILNSYSALQKIRALYLSDPQDIWSGINYGFYPRNL